MACSEKFWRQDGPYSWLMLFVIVLNSSMGGLLYTTIGIMTEKYPHVLDIEQSSSNLVGAVALGIYMFTGKMLL